MYNKNLYFNHIINIYNFGHVLFYINDNFNEFYWLI